MIEQVISTFALLRQNTFSQTGSGLFYFSMFFLLVILKEKEWRWKFVYPVYILFLSFAWNVFFDDVWDVLFSGAGARAAALIPVSAVIALAVAYCCSVLKGKDVILAGAAVLLLMYFVSDQDYEDYLADFSRVENVYGLPQDVVDVCDLVLSEEKEPMLIVADEDMIYFRQYSAAVKLLYGNNLYGTMGDAMEIPGDYVDMAVTLENTEFINLAAFGERADAYGVDYIIINTETHDSSTLYNEGETYFTLYANLGVYAVYKNNSLYVN